MNTNQGLEIAKDFFAKNGHLYTKKDTVWNGYRLGDWVYTMRGRYKNGTISPILYDELSKIGMIWNLNEVNWERKFQLAENYYKEHGDLFVPQDYVVDDVKLGSWLQTQRRAYKQPDKYKPLTDEQIARLEAIGISWDTYKDLYKKQLKVLTDYYNEHGNLDVDYETESEVYRVLYFVRRKKRKGELSEEAIRAFDKLGIDWRDKKGQ